MDDTTIIRLAQLVTACVCVICGAAVAKAAVNGGANLWWKFAGGVALSVVFVYAAITLATRGFYFTYG